MVLVGEEYQTIVGFPTSSPTRAAKLAMTVPFTTLEDSILIDLALGGNAEGFAVLVDRHASAVRKRISLIVNDAADADDLLQETLFKVWRRLKTFRTESSFRTWMTSVAINEVFQSFRRNRRTPLCHTGGDITALACGSASPYQSLARVEVVRAVRRGVNALPVMYRQILILRDIEQVSTREAAQRLRSSIPAVKSRLFRARIMLAEVLRRPECRGLARRPRRSVADIACCTAHSDAIADGR